MIGKGLGAAGWLWLSLLGLFLFTAGPILVALTAGLVAATLGCQLDEGNIHACPLLGIDLGGVLYFFGMFGWFTLMTIPFGAMGLLVWLGFAVGPADQAPAALQAGLIEDGRCSRSASFPASTSRTAASSRASTSSICATPAIRSRRRSPMTPPAPTSSCFLDITASHENRDIILDVVRRTAEACFMPLTVGGGVRTVDDIRKLLACGADKVSINTAAVARRAFVKEAAEKFGDQCIVVAIDAKKVSQAGRAGPLGDLHPWRPPPDRARCGRLRARGGGARRRRNPADLDGPRRHPAGLRHRADPRHRRRRAGAGDRLGRRRHARSSGRGHPRRPRHRGAGRLDLPFRRVHGARRPRSTWRRPACRCGSIPSDSWRPVRLLATLPLAQAQRAVRAGRCPRTVRRPRS